MEVLAGVTTIVAVVQTTNRILTLCADYASGVKHAREHIGRLEIKVEALNKVFTNVYEMSKSGEMELYASQSVLQGLVGTIMDCKTLLSDLETQLDPGKGRKMMNRFGLRALTWPLKYQELTKITETLDQHKVMITLALNLDLR